MTAARRTNRHHLFHPRKDYTTATERKFRGLPCNIIRLDKQIHTLLHVHSEPPQKPSVKEMKIAILRHKLRDCGCYE